MKARHFTAVLADVLGAIPDDQTDIRADLLKLQETARYTAPEVMRKCWSTLETILMSGIGTPTEEWHRTVSKIVLGGK